MNRRTIISSTPPADQAQPLRLEPLESARKRIAVSRPTIYRLIRRDPLFPRPVKIGSRTLFVVAEIDAWLQAQVAAFITGVRAGAGAK